MKRNGWRVLLNIRRMTTWGLMVLLCAALAKPESLEWALKTLPKIQFGQLAAGWLSFGTTLLLAPTLIMTLSTLILGRWFCGWLCPLGASMDFARLAHLGVEKKNRHLSFVPDRFWRSIVPIALWASFWLGLSVPMGELEPYSVVVSGPIIWMIILAVAAWMGRAFCNSICPTGWLLKLLGGRPLLGLKIDRSKCRGCGACQRICPARCVDSRSKEIDRGRCLTCLICAARCPDEAISFGRLPVFGAGSIPSSRRRDFLRLAALGALAGGGRASSEEWRCGFLPPPSATPILPPGALSLAHLAAHCTSCHTCVRICPNEALDSAREGGPILLGKPILDPYIGFCQYDCVLCASVCPTGALMPMTPEVKRTHRIGLAALERLECVVVKNGTSCGACAELCPSGAVSMAIGPSGLLEPTLDDSFCIGCGACQKACPIRPKAAIVVSGLLIQQTAKTPEVIDAPDEVLTEDFPF